MSADGRCRGSAVTLTPVVAFDKMEGEEGSAERVTDGKTGNAAISSVVMATMKNCFVLCNYGFPILLSFRL